MERKKHLKLSCEQLGLGDTTLNNDTVGHLDVSRIYVDDKYKLLYCEVPKVACTNWKRILLILTGKMNTTDPTQLRSSLVHTIYQSKYLRTLNTYRPEEILFRIRQYYKFMFVREPLERIVSAYRNKFLTSYNQPFRLRYGRQIIRRYRENATKHSLQYGDDVRFNEFVQYLLDLKANEVFDIHWRHFYKLCHPCQLRYNFIGKHETLTEDVKFIFEELRIKQLFTFPEPPNKSQPTTDLTKSILANLSFKQLHDLWRLYSIDATLFGYSYRY
ncbi:hypothetical protein LSH36_332g01009 [Paralvinella palmiformis]|uniref:Carbohydrate sulfotransferase n=1 Tax=Paralvinella palmiformis TaxID=53620 RepID=A0AAD9N075_9ANNE|nr:hypothetical protein LSH36_332g01009 [Paralvinella palmiformis]